MTNELENLAQPLIDWLKKHGNPYTQIVISSEKIRVTEDVLGLPVKE